MVLKIKKAVKRIFIFTTDLVWRALLVGKPKIFVISCQKSGTKSVGKFFKDHNYRVASHSISNNNNWNLKWFKGDFNTIFNSNRFKSHQVFEDDPWFFPDFYKYLYHKFPNSKFILFKRESNAWFDSMKAFKNGKSLGNTYIHSKIYRREADFYNLDDENHKYYSNIKDSRLILSEEHREHYVSLYDLRVREVLEFFNEVNSERLFYANLEDSAKWEKLGIFLNIKVSKDYNAHENKNIYK